MAGNSPSFNKRQKERARQQKQAEKAQKRLERKQQKEVGLTSDAPEANADGAIELDEFGMPKGLDFHDF